MKNIIILILLSCISLSLVAQNKKDEQGRKQGYWEKTTPMGQKIYAGYFKDNYPEGEMIRYHQNGLIKARLIFSNKGKHTKAKLYNTYEELLAEGNYLNQKKDSLWYYYNKDGEIRIKEYYSAGKKNGLITYYYPSGETYETYEYKNDLKHGKWVRYNKHGEKIIHANYLNGKLDDAFTTYFNNGIIKIDGFYKNGKRDKKWLFYNEKGQIDKTITYQMGVAENQDELDAKQQEELDALEANKDKIIDPEHYIQNPTEYLMKQREK